jgi:hypothetical protein
MKKLILLVALFVSNAAQAKEPEPDYKYPTPEATVAWFDCQDVGTDAGQGLRGIERSSRAHYAHWDCLTSRGFTLNFDRCPFRYETAGSGYVPPPYCWEAMSAEMRALWKKSHPGQ